MPTVLNWPESGEWLLGRAKSPIGHNAGGFYAKADAPFAVLTVYFKSRTGTIREGQNTVAINGIQLVQSADGPKFSAPYAIGAHSGRFEATVHAKYELEIEFTGTAVTSVNAFPQNIVGGDKSVSSLSTQDKLQEAIRRALPMLPGAMAHEVQALFTPAAIALLAGVGALWAASHAAVIGWIADLALLLTAGLLLGKAAYDVGTHLAEFMVGACGAQNDEELDAAARHFADAVLIGGTTLVASILFSKKAPGRPTKYPGPPAEPGRLPTESNMVPRSRIPPPSRAPLVQQGQQPKLAGLAQETQEAVRGMLNKFRKGDLEGRPTDCTEAADALKQASGGKGTVGEYSGMSEPARVTDHRMWELGDEFIDTRPGMWREIFKTNPAAREALNRLVSGLAERLESGAVLSAAEHQLYRYGAQSIRPPGARPTPGQPRPGSKAGPQPH